MSCFSYKKENSKIVKKPWGHEIWISDASTKSKFAMKEIFIKSGFKTSYQFHALKHESAIIVSGSGRLLLSDEKIDLNKFKENMYSEDELKKIINDLKYYKLSSGSVMQIEPLYIHSIISEIDITLIESSTLELDDVFRIFDENGRSHGKILSEHI